MKVFVDILVLLPALLLFKIPVVASISGTSLDKNEDSPADTVRGARQLKGGVKGYGGKSKKGVTTYYGAGGKNKSGKNKKGGHSYGAVSGSYKGVGNYKNGGGKSKKGGGKKGSYKQGKTNFQYTGGSGKYGDYKAAGKKNKRYIPSDFGNNFAAELYPCISPNEASVQGKATHPFSEPGCLQGSCGGCCRDYSYLICDNTGQMPYMRCICGTGSFGNGAINVGNSYGNGGGSGSGYTVSGGSNFQGAGGGPVNVGSTTVTYGGNPGTNSNGAYVGQIQVISPP